MLTTTPTWTLANPVYIHTECTVHWIMHYSSNAAYVTMYLTNEYIHSHAIVFVSAWLPTVSDALIIT